MPPAPPCAMHVSPKPQLSVPGDAQGRMQRIVPEPGMQTSGETQTVPIVHVAPCVAVMICAIVAHW